MDSDLPASNLPGGAASQAARRRFESRFLSVLAVEIRHALMPRRSPLSGVDECSCRLAEPLCDAHREIHVREASLSQISQPAWRAVEFVRQLCPREIARMAILVERCVCLLQVPSKPAVCSCRWQCHIAHVDNRTCQEVLRRTAKPPQHEQPILARGCPSLLQSRDRSTAQRMIRSLCVEF
jgi:hypothetical protein